MRLQEARAAIQRLASLPAGLPLPDHMKPSTSAPIIQRAPKRPRDDTPFEWEAFDRSLN